MEQFITEHFLPHIGAFISAMLSGLAGFIFGRKKEKAEMKKLENENEAIDIENTDKMVNVYQRILDDLTQRYEAKFWEITELYEHKIKLMQDEIGLLERNIKLLKEENRLLRQKLKDNGVN